jgi:hypothetical protein
LIEEQRQASGDRVRFEPLAFMAAGDARRDFAGIELLMQDIVAAIGDVLRRMSAHFAQLIGQFVGSDGEKIGLQLARFVIVRQARQETDKRLLYDVLAGRAIAQSAIDEREQSAFVSRDEVLPGARVALANLLDQNAIAF